MSVLKFVTACALSGAALTAQVIGAPISSTQSTDSVIQWNRSLLGIVRTPGAQPATIHPTRSFAILHAAIYDAVNAIDGTHESYAVRFSGVSRQASQAAAADAAAHDVLVALYPLLTSTLDATLQQSLAVVPDGAAKKEGIRIGQIVAQAILSLRSNDGANQAPLPYVFGTAPGDYQSTPPNFPRQPQFTHWRNVTPFALNQADQFRPGAPPSLTSDRYADDVNEVQSLGVSGGTTATPDEALTGRFWNGAVQNYWNEIAQTASLDRHLSIAEEARLFALLNLSFADSVVAFYDAKYTYNRWRPVTAIRAGGTDANPETAPDANWLPEVGNTTPDPAYPGAHAVISAAAATILTAVFHRDHLDFAVTSEVLPGVERSFASFSAAADEATESRIFAGVHFRNDLTIGDRLGRDVADFVLDHFLRRRHGRDEDDVSRRSTVGRRQTAASHFGRSAMKRVTRVERGTSRRSFLRRGMVSAGAATLSATVMGKELSAFERADAREGPAITEGDIAILRFLAAAELIERDLWEQYNELAGVDAAPSGYVAALSVLDEDMAQYISDNTDDEISHETFLNAYLVSKGAPMVNLDEFRRLPSSHAPGAAQIGRLTNLMQLSVDTSWWTRYRSPKNPDLGGAFPQLIPSLNKGQHPAIPRNEAELGDPASISDHVQAIANTAAFHFAFIEEGGSSLYPTLAQQVSNLEVLRILLSIGPTETAHFQTWHDKAGNAPSVTDGSLVFPDLNAPALQGEDVKKNLIMPEPCAFISAKLPPCSIIRPTGTRGGGAVATIDSFRRDGLFIGQGNDFLQYLFALASAADQAQREL